MFINKNSNVSKASSIFGVSPVSNNTKKNEKQPEHKIDFLVDDLIESQYITRNFQIGLTYVQIAKSTLAEVKDTIYEMKEILDKCLNQDNLSYWREVLNVKFIKLRDKFHLEANKLNVDVRENLFYNANNELVFKVFDSKFEECILIPRLNPHKFNLMGINISNDINTKIANERINDVLEYILSSEKVIKTSEEKLSKVNLTDIMSSNLVALSSNENKDSINKLITYTKNGLIKSNFDCNSINLKKKNIDDLLK